MERVIRPSSTVRTLTLDPNLIPLGPYPRLRARHSWPDRARLGLSLLPAFPLAAVLFGLALLVASLPEPEIKLMHPPAAVSLLPLSSQEWMANRQLGAKTDNVPQPETTTVAEPPKPQEKTPSKTHPGQVVDVAPTPDTHVPDDTHRVSEYNTHVLKEMQARDKTAFYKNAMPRHTTVSEPTQLPGTDRGEKVQAVGEQSAGQDQHTVKAKQPGQRMEIPEVQKRDKIAIAPGERGEMPDRPGSEGVKGNSDRLRLQTGEGDGETPQTAGNNGTGAHLNLMPSQSILDRIAGAPPNDHLEGVDEGDSTFLNTREWKYAGFFNRVKQSVGEHWDPGSVMRRRDPSGQIYGWRDRRTIVSVVLDRGGVLSDLSVEKSCGVDFLDEEAMAAFRRAQPFPNPPSALLDDQGKVKFSFGFYLEMNSGGLRIFR